jgi:methyl-accepting chemotaxis protein
MRRESTYERLAAIEETMVTPEGRAAYEEIEKALDAYFEMEAEVVESISATAQEAFATSEELSAQATCMDELVAKFQLRD